MEPFDARGHEGQPSLRRRLFWLPCVAAAVTGVALLIPSAGAASATPTTPTTVHQTIQADKMQTSNKNLEAVNVYIRG